MYLFDLHCDTASLIYHHQLPLKNHTHHVDLNKLKHSNYSGQWFAYFVDTKHLQDTTPLETVLEMDRYFKAQCEANSETITIVTSYEAYQAAKNAHKISAFLSVEEGQVLSQDINHLDLLYHLGIRMMTLTWNYPNDLGAPHSLSDKGLTPFGREVADALNGRMLLDISHLSRQGVLEASAIYKGPLIASHCNAYAAYAHTRNLQDDILYKIAESGGVIGINFYSAFLSSSNISRIEDILMHIAYLYNKIGSEHIALGTDFDGIDCALEIENAQEMDKLIHALLKIYPTSLVEKIAYLNVERVIKENF